MVNQIPGDHPVGSECDLAIINKLNEVISEVNNIEAKLQSASPTNKQNVPLEYGEWMARPCDNYDKCPVKNKNTLLC